MGTWGPGVFEDDCTLECFTDLRDSESIEYISNALEDAVDSIYLDYETSCAAVVAAAVIDALVNDMDYDSGNGQFMEWVNQNRKMPVVRFKNEAVKALRRVLSEDSELYEQWLENDSSFMEWKAGLENIIMRLAE
jgi:hypothetical protein